MAGESTRLIYLLEQYANNQCTRTEMDELLGYVQRNESEDVLHSFFDKEWDQLELVENKVKWEEMFERMMVRNEEQGTKYKGRMYSINWSPSTALRRWVAVAAVFLVLVAGYLIVDNSREDGKTGREEKNMIADIAPPDKTKAMITLADGRTISLDSLTSITQGDVQISKTNDGRLIYEATQLTTDNSQPQYNTLYNPRGSKVIDMQLSDGSHVWLNAGSSVTYPVVFIGDERKVSMKGEAYFEVASYISRKDAKKQPFIVEKDAMQVQVLGTKFNVNAYDDERDIKVTLLEGSVRVLQLTTGNSLLIKPGQQVAITPSTNDPIHHSPFSIHQADLSAVMSWKNGMFEFSNTTLDVILRQISRWYDVQVVYGSGSGARFGGGLSRQLPLSNVIKLLEANGVRVDFDGKKLIVK